MTFGMLRPNIVSNVYLADRTELVIALTLRRNVSFWFSLNGHSKRLGILGMLFPFLMQRL